jgi:hypothetical protein
MRTIMILGCFLALVPEVATAADWYWCEATRQFYPAVTTCAAGWQKHDMPSASAQPGGEMPIPPDVIAARAPPEISNPSTPH